MNTRWDELKSQSSPKLQPFLEQFHFLRSIFVVIAKKDEQKSECNPNQSGMKYLKFGWSRGRRSELSSRSWAAFRIVLRRLQFGAGKWRSKSWWSSHFNHSISRSDTEMQSQLSSCTVCILQSHWSVLRLQRQCLLSSTGKMQFISAE